MALDRQEAQAQIDVLNVPSVTNSDNGVLLKNNILDNVVFRKDEKSSTSGAGLSVFLADFTNNEQVILTGVNQNITISFTGLEDGDVRFLVMTKQAANIVSFAGALDMVQNRAYVNSAVTSIVYRVSLKNGVIYVEGIFAPANTSFINLTLAGNWSGSAKYRINNFTGQIEMELAVQFDSAGITLVSPLPAAIQPSRVIGFTLMNTIIPNVVAAGYISAGGDIFIDNTPLTVTRTYYGVFEFYKTLP